MNGCVIEGTPIAIDFWKPTKAPQARLFFLTHLHADHIQGLTNTWRLPIFTSPVNARLLEHKFKLPKSIFRELEVGETHLIPLDVNWDYTISVTVLDANHVPGAVMFLFQGYFGNILYCGDMRWYPELLENKVLKDVVEMRELDVLYLDNTFSAPYCVFPSRKDAMQELFKIIDSYPDHVIKLGIRDLGREDLLEAVARRFQERILVTQKKLKILQLLRYSDSFTTDPDEARIHAVPMHQVQVSSHKRWNNEYPTITIMLTGLFVGWTNGPFTSQPNSGIFIVPYSDHSSYPELMEMVGQLAPHCVKPIVKMSKSGLWSDPNAPDHMVKGDMSVYEHFLTLSPPTPFVVPDAVAMVMKAGSPVLLPHRPRRCRLRRGLSHTVGRAQGIVFTSPDSRSSSPASQAYSPAPTSSVTLDMSLSDTPMSHHRIYPYGNLTPNSNGSPLPSNIVSGTQLYAPSTINEIQTDSELSIKRCHMLEQPTSGSSELSNKRCRMMEQPTSGSSELSNKRCQMMELAASGASELSNKQCRMMEQPASGSNSELSNKRCHMMEQPASGSNSEFSNKRCRMMEQPASGSNSELSNKRCHMMEQPISGSSELSNKRCRMMEQPASGSSELSNKQCHMMEQPASGCNSELSNKQCHMMEQPASGSNSELSNKRCHMMEQPASGSSELSNKRCHMMEQPASGSSELSNKRCHMMEQPALGSNSELSNKRCHMMEQPASGSSELSNKRCHMMEQPASGSNSELSNKRCRMMEQPASGSSELSNKRCHMMEQPTSGSSELSNKRCHMMEQPALGSNSKLSKKRCRLMEQPTSGSSELSNKRCHMMEQPASGSNLLLTNNLVPATQNDNKDMFRLPVLRSGVSSTPMKPSSANDNVSPTQETSSGQSKRSKLMKEIDKLISKECAFLEVNDGIAANDLSQVLLGARTVCKAVERLMSHLTEPF